MPFEVTGLLSQLTCVLCACCIYTHTLYIRTHMEFLEGFTALDEAE